MVWQKVVMMTGFEQRTYGAITWARSIINRRFVIRIVSIICAWIIRIWHVSGTFQAQTPHSNLFSRDTGVAKIIFTTIQTWIAMATMIMHTHIVPWLFVQFVTSSFNCGMFIVSRCYYLDKKMIKTVIKKKTSNLKKKKKREKNMACSGETGNRSPATSDWSQIQCTPTV